MIYLSIVDAQLTIYRRSGESGVVGVVARGCGLQAGDVPQGAPIVQHSAFRGLLSRLFRKPCKIITHITSLVNIKIELSC